MTIRELPAPSPFAGDDGSADPQLVAALTRYAADGDAGPVLVTLSGARLLVPVLPHATGQDVPGEQVGCHDATVGVVAVAGPDGRTALPVFSSVATLSAWRPDARPVPATAARAAASALVEGWPVLVLDAAGPVQLVLGRPAVQALAEGRVWIPAVRAGTVDPDVAVAVREAVHAVPGVVGAQAEPGTRSEVAVRLGLVDGLDRAGLERVVARADAALAAHPVVAARVDSIELRLVRG